MLRKLILHCDSINLKRHVCSAIQCRKSSLENNSNLYEMRSDDTGRIIVDSGPQPTANHEGLQSSNEFKPSYLQNLASKPKAILNMPYPVLIAYRKENQIRDKHACLLGQIWLKCASFVLVQEDKNLSQNPSQRVWIFCQKRGQVKFLIAIFRPLWVGFPYRAYMCGILFLSLCSELNISITLFNLTI